MKTNLKYLFRQLFKLLCLPLLFWYKVNGALLEKEKVFYSFSQFLSLFPGITGEYLRFAFYSFTIKHLGADTCLCFGSTLAHPDIEIGNGVYVGPNCNLGLCKLEDDVLLGTGVHVMSGTQQHSFDDLDTPIREQKRTLVKVVIGRDTWLGNGAIVGANVGEKSIIGANATVTKDIPSYSIAAGNPAKVIRKRENK